MKKPKKITVKFFLNTNLKPLAINGESCYPLYTQVTYDRKNTQIKCAYGWFYKDLKDCEAELLHFEEQVLKKSVNYELSIQGDEFRLKGLGKKYENYCLSIHALFNSYLKIRFKNIIKQARPAKFLEVLSLDRSKTDFFTIYEASQRLFDNLPDIISEDFKNEMQIYQDYTQMFEKELKNESFQFPVVIDWLEGSHQRSLEDKLKGHLSNQPQEMQTYLNLIHKIVSSKVELV